MPCHHAGVAPAMRQRRDIRIPDGLAIGLAYESSLDTGIDIPECHHHGGGDRALRFPVGVHHGAVPGRRRSGGAVEYSADLWDAATVEAWSRDYVRLLREGAEEPLTDEAG
ncbi:Carrier domain-containing protein OS=Streptomyces microflavus OX=1919 GN=Smic_01440 PE=4 SV=1 [Streptomyces microflavus]